MSPLGSNESPPARQGSADWTGAIVAVLLAPVFVLFVYLGYAEKGFTTYLVSCALAIAIKLRWNLRKHVWFWVTIALVVAAHIPLLVAVRWPKSNVPTIVLSMPLGIADFLVMSGAISLAEKAFSARQSPDENVG